MGHHHEGESAADWLRRRGPRYHHHAQRPQQHWRDDRLMKLTGVNESLFLSVKFHLVITKFNVLFGRLGHTSIQVFWFLPGFGRNALFVISVGFCSVDVHIMTC